MSKLVKIAQGYPEQLEAFPVKENIRKTLSTSRENPVNNQPTNMQKAIDNSVKSVGRDVVDAVKGFVGPSRGLSLWHPRQAALSGVNAGLNYINPIPLLSGAVNGVVNAVPNAVNGYNWLKYMNSAPGTKQPAHMSNLVDIPSGVVNVPGADPASGSIGRVAQLLVLPQTAKMLPAAARAVSQSIRNRFNAFNKKRSTVFGIPGQRMRLGRGQWQNNISKAIAADDPGYWKVVSGEFGEAVPESDIVLRGIIDPGRKGIKYKGFEKVISPNLRDRIYTRSVDGLKPGYTASSSRTFAGTGSRGLDLVGDDIIALIDDSNVMRYGKGSPLVTLDSIDPDIIGPGFNPSTQQQAFPDKYPYRLAKARQTDPAKFSENVGQWGEVVRVPGKAHLPRTSKVSKSGRAFAGNANDITDILTRVWLRDGRPTYAVFGRAGRPSGLSKNIKYMNNPWFRLIK